MNRNLPALVLLHEGTGSVVGVVASIALGRYSQIDDGLPQGQQLATSSTMAVAGSVMMAPA